MLWWPLIGDVGLAIHVSSRGPVCPSVAAMSSIVDGWPLCGEYVGCLWKTNVICNAILSSSRSCVRLRVQIACEYRDEVVWPIRASLVFIR